LATAVTSLQECRRLYGANAKTHRINGNVQEVIHDRPLSGRASTSLKVEWIIKPGRDQVKKTNTLKLNRIRLGHIDPHEPETTETEDASQLEISSTNVHDVDWYEEEVSVPIGGSDISMNWKLKMNDDGTLSESSGLKEYTLLDIFLSLFPTTHLSNMASWTSAKLTNIETDATSET